MLEAVTFVGRGSVLCKFQHSAELYSKHLKTAFIKKPRSSDLEYVTRLRLDAIKQYLLICGQLLIIVKKQKDNSTIKVVDFQKSRLRPGEERNLYF